MRLLFILFIPEFFGSVVRPVVKRVSSSGRLLAVGEGRACRGAGGSQPRAGESTVGDQEATGAAGGGSGSLPCGLTGARLPESSCGIKGKAETQVLPSVARLQSHQGSRGSAALWLVCRRVCYAASASAAGSVCLCRGRERSG